MIDGRPEQSGNIGLRHFVLFRTRVGRWGSPPYRRRSLAADSQQFGSKFGR